MLLCSVLSQERRCINTEDNTIEFVNFWFLVRTCSPQEALVFPVVLLQADLQVHFGDVTHDCDGLLSKPDEYLAEVVLKLWSRMDQAVERHTIHLGRRVEDDPVLGGRPVRLDDREVRKIPRILLRGGCYCSLQIL